MFRHLIKVVNDLRFVTNASIEPFRGMFRGILFVVGALAKLPFTISPWKRLLMEITFPDIPICLDGISTLLVIIHLVESIPSVFLQ
jgi:hypothetical protein